MKTNAQNTTNPNLMPSPTFEAARKVLLAQRGVEPVATIRAAAQETAHGTLGCVPFKDQNALIAAAARERQQPKHQPRRR